MTENGNYSESGKGNTMDLSAPNAIPGFPPDVEAALEGLSNSTSSETDPLDGPNFDAVDYINKLFPTEQSLSSIDAVVTKIQKRIHAIDEESRHIIRGDMDNENEGREAVSEAKRTIQILFSKIKEVQERSITSEAMVWEITRDIQALDQAKRNLTWSITTLNNLVLLMTAVDRLKVLLEPNAEKLAYEDIARHLGSAQNVLAQFAARFQDIPQIKQLHTDVRVLQGELTKRVHADLKEFLAASSARALQANRQAVKHACLVLDLLDSKSAKKDFMDWFIRQQLSEYLVLFDATQTVAWLDKIDRRYAWVKKLINDFKTKFGGDERGESEGIFPTEWLVSERIVVEFCRLTHSELSRMMASRKREISVKLLLFAIQRTSKFEEDLEETFTGRTLTSGEVRRPENGDVERENGPDEEELDPSNPFYEESRRKEEPPHREEPPEPEKALGPQPFRGIISRCFEEHLDVYIESQDRNLSELIARFLSDASSTAVPLTAPPTSGEGEGEDDGAHTAATNVFPSCADLFFFYKNCMVQCAQLSTGTPMLQLMRIFKKYLREYANRLLVANLPGAPLGTGGGGVGSGGGAAGLAAEARSGANQFLQAILNTDSSSNHTKLSGDDQARICHILCTADYCLETTGQLESKLKEKVDASLKAQVDFRSELDMFHSCISSCIHMLVSDLEAVCEPALNAMTKMAWGSVRAVGDQSNYVNALVTHWGNNVPSIRDHLARYRKYFTQFCVKFVNAFVPKFTSAMLKCRPISAEGAEQLLLDTHSLKTALLGLPLIGSQVQRKAPASYVKFVVKGMTKAEMMMKVLMQAPMPAHLSVPGREGGGGLPSSGSSSALSNLTQLGVDAGGQVGTGEGGSKDVLSPVSVLAFVDSFLQLLPESDQVEFQRLAEMRGYRRSELNCIMEAYRQRVAKLGLNVAVNTAGSSGTQSATTKGSGVGEWSRIRKLEKLIKKRL